MTTEEHSPRRKRPQPEAPIRRPLFELSGSWPFPTSAEIERRFEELIRARWGGSEADAPVDVFVREDEIWVEIDLPGVEEGEVRAQIQGRTLVIDATRRPVAPPGEARAARLERPRGPLQRRVPLPSEISGAQLELSGRAVGSAHEPGSVSFEIDGELDPLARGVRRFGAEARH